MGNPDLTDALTVLVVTVDEYYYIPRFLQRILDSEEIDVVGLTTMPPSLGTQGMIPFAYDLFRRFGPTVFLKHAMFYGKYRLLDVLARYSGSGRAYSCRALAERYGIDYRHVTDVNAPEYVEYVENREPDVLVSVAATQKFESPLLDTPSKCAINIHSSLLPEYRGVSPSFWALLNDEPRTGVSVHLMDEALDAGDLIRQEPIDIDADDTLHSLNARVADVGSETLLAALEDIKSGSVERTPINTDDGSYYSMPERSDVREFRRRGRRFY